MNFIPAKNSPVYIKEPKLFFLFQNKKLLITHTEDNISIRYVHDTANLPVTLTSPQYLGCLDGTHCFTGEIDTTMQIPKNMSFQGLHSLHGSLNDDLFAIAGRVFHITDWDNTYQFCSKCGNHLKEKENEHKSGDAIPVINLQWPKK